MAFVDVVRKDYPEKTFRNRRGWEKTIPAHYEVVYLHGGAKIEEMPTQDGGVAYVDKGHMFMKTAAFFSRSQVEETDGQRN